MEKLTSSAVWFRKSKTDECVFYGGGGMYILYNDASILAGPYEEGLKYIVFYIKASGLDTNAEGDIEDLLVVNIDKVESETYHITHP